jgi:hypothetical protein
MSNCLFHYLYQTFPTINLLTSYNDKFLFSNLLTLKHNKKNSLHNAKEHLENSLRQSFVHSTPKPDTQASAIYIENISKKSEDGEQFNSFQENCDEVVQIESEHNKKNSLHNAK